MKLNQSFENLYSLPYYEYSYYLNLLIKDAGTIVNEKIDIGQGSTE